MFAQSIETKFFDNTNFIPTPAWIYWLLILTGATFGITMFLQNVTDRVMPFIIAAVAFSGITIIAMAMMNAVMRSNSMSQMAGRLAYTLFGGTILFALSAITCIIAIAIAVIALILWIFGAAISGLTAKEIVVDKGIFGGTKKVLAHENLDGSFTGLDGKKYKKKNSWF